MVAPGKQSGVGPEGSQASEAPVPGPASPPPSLPPGVTFLGSAHPKLQSSLCLGRSPKPPERLRQRQRWKTILSRPSMSPLCQGLKFHEAPGGHLPVPWGPDGTL